MTKMGASRFQYDSLSRLLEAEVPVVPDSCTEDLSLTNQTFGSTATREACGQMSAGSVVRVTGTEP